MIHRLLKYVNRVIKHIFKISKKYCIKSAPRTKLDIPSGIKDINSNYLLYDILDSSLQLTYANSFAEIQSNKEFWR